jgi:hypothetical protein
MNNMTGSNIYGNKTFNMFQLWPYLGFSLKKEAKMRKKMIPRKKE